jgi:hypothetical protein
MATMLVIQGGVPPTPEQAAFQEQYERSRCEPVPTGRPVTTGRRHRRTGERRRPATFTMTCSTSWRVSPGMRPSTRAGSTGV